MTEITNKNNLNSFLLNSTEQEMLINLEYLGLRKIRKEQINDRFYVLYCRQESNNMKQNDYEVCGYFDVINKTLYDLKYYLDKYIQNDEIIQKKYFSDVEEEIANKVNDYITEYVLENESDFEIFGKEKYLSQKHWYLSDEWDIKKEFISSKKANIKFNINYRTYDIFFKTDFFESNNILKYLNNSDEYILEISNALIEKNKEDLGYKLLCYYDKLDYLEKIEKNLNNEFSSIHINKNIYNAIKDIDAKNVNITIKYDNDYISFHFSYDRLKSELLCGNIGCCDFSKSYKVISDFIKERKVSDRYNYEDFEFSHIESIKYGKKELYNKNNYKQINQKKNKQMER